MEALRAYRQLFVLSATSVRVPLPSELLRLIADYVLDLDSASGGTSAMSRVHDLQSEQFPRAWCHIAHGPGPVFCTPRYVAADGNHLFIRVTNERDATAIALPLKAFLSLNPWVPIGALWNHDWSQGAAFGTLTDFAAIECAVEDVVRWRASSQFDPDHKCYMGEEPGGCRCPGRHQCITAGPKRRPCRCRHCGPEFNGYNVRRMVSPFCPLCSAFVSDYLRPYYGRDGRIVGSGHLGQADNDCFLLCGPCSARVESAGLFGAAP